VRVSSARYALSLHDALPIWRALVDVGLAIGDGRGVGTAAGIAALAALRLRQDGVDLVDERIALDLEADGGPAQGSADLQRQHGQDRKSTRLNSSHVKISYAV